MKVNIFNFICSHYVCFYSKLSWRDDSTGQGFNLAYPDISLHAVSKDTTHFPHECLFCMVDVAFQGKLLSHITTVGIYSDSV